MRNEDVVLLQPHSFCGFYKALAQGGELQQHPRGWQQSAACEQIDCTLGRVEKHLKLLWLLLPCSGSGAGFGCISASLFQWLWRAGAGQQSWRAPTLVWELLSCKQLRSLSFHVVFGRSSSFYSGFSWQDTMFQCKVKVKTKPGENQTQMFLPHWNETFWYICQNKRESWNNLFWYILVKIKTAPSKCFGFSRTAFSYGGKNPQHSSEMFSTGSSVEFVTRTSSQV